MPAFLRPLALRLSHLRPWLRPGVGPSLVGVGGAGPGFQRSVERKRVAQLAMNEIKPALTPEEWERETNPDRTALDERIRWACKEAGANDAVTPHALAALALHGKPFGFLWDDVEDLIELAESLEAVDLPLKGDGLRQIAARIAALLPPRHR